METKTLLYNKLNYSEPSVYTKAEVDGIISRIYGDLKIDITALDDYIRENYVSKQELNDILYSRSLVGRIKNLLHKAHTSITNFIHRKERKE